MEAIMRIKGISVKRKLLSFAHTGDGIARMVRFGDRVKQLREAKGWSQEALAAAIGLKQQSTIHRLEQRLHPPRATTISKLAKAFGLSVEQFMYDVVKPWDEVANVELAPDISDALRGLDDDDRADALNAINEAARALLRRTS